MLSGDFKFILQSLMTSKMKKQQTKKLSQLHKVKTFRTKNSWFSGFMNKLWKFSVTIWWYLWTALTKRKITLWIQIDWTQNYLSLNLWQKGTSELSSDWLKDDHFVFVIWIQTCYLNFDLLFKFGFVITYIFGLFIWLWVCYLNLYLLFRFVFVIWTCTCYLNLYFLFEFKFIFKFVIWVLLY